MTDELSFNPPADSKPTPAQPYSRWAHEALQEMIRLLDENPDRVQFIEVMVDSEQREPRMRRITVGVEMSAALCNHDLESPDKTLKATLAPHYGWRCTVCSAEWYPAGSGMPSFRNYSREP